jgi:hypothetical protein
VEEIQLLIEKGVIFEPTIDENIKNISNPDLNEDFENTVRHALGLVGVMFGVNFNRLREAKKGNTYVSDEELDEILHALDKVRKKKKRKSYFQKAIESNEFMEHVRGMMKYQTRIFSIKLREIDGFDAYPILGTPLSTSIDSPITKNDVVRIVLDAMPIPDESTSWEKILEYRSDPDSSSKFLDLRVWMSEMARAKLTQVELEEKLQQLLDDYERHLRLHKIKTHRGTLQTVVIATAEFFEDLANKKFSKIAQGIFTVTQQRVELLEGELMAPGSEVAYIMKANETFNRERT